MMNDSDKTNNVGQPVIHIEGERASKLFALLADMADTVSSLKTAAKLFPKESAIQEGELFPLTTTLGYACVLDDMAATVMSFANGDDLKDAGREARHAKE